MTIVGYNKGNELDTLENIWLQSDHVYAAAYERFESMDKDDPGYEDAGHDLDVAFRETYSRWLDLTASEHKALVELRDAVVQADLDLFNLNEQFKVVGSRYVQLREEYEAKYMELKNGY